MDGAGFHYGELTFRIEISMANVLQHNDVAAGEGDDGVAHEISFVALPMRTL